jgi:hypothetical protein
MSTLGDMIGDDGPEAPTDTELKTISNLIKEQVSLEDQIEDMGKQLKDKAARLRKLSEEHIPAALKAVGTSQFKTDDGLEVDVKEKMSASIAKKNKPAVVQWLKDHDAEALVKNIIQVAFGKGDDEKAAEAFKILEAAGFNAIQTVDINTTTLKAYVKEQLGNGTDIPLELFGVYVYNATTIKRK